MNMSTINIGHDDEEERRRQAERDHQFWFGCAPVTAVVLSVVCVLGIIALGLVFR